MNFGCFRIPDLVVVEDFFHECPPVSLGAVLQRLLHWLHDGPPTLGGRIGGHLFHISRVVLAYVLEIAEQQAIAQENRIIADVAARNRVQHGGPNRSMVLAIGRLGLGSQANDHSVASHAQMMTYARAPLLWRPVGLSGE